MDKLIRISDGHKKIAEMPSMYKEILNNVKFFNPIDYIASLNRILQETILPHFEYEEKEIFPLLLVRGDSNTQAAVLVLKQEHGQLTDKLNLINKLRSELGSVAGTKEKEKLISLCSEITRELNEHALKEDTMIFPRLKEADLSF